MKCRIRTPNERVWCITQLAKLSSNHSIGRTHSWRFSFFIKNNFFHKQRTYLCPTCSRYPAPTPRTRVNLPGLFYELSTLKLIYTTHQVHCCILCCTLSESFILHYWSRLFSSYSYVRTHQGASDALTWNTLEYAYFFNCSSANKHTCLCPSSSRYPSTDTTYVSPTSRFNVNEQKMIWVHTYVFVFCSFTLNRLFGETYVVSVDGKQEEVGHKQVCLFAEE